jgi:hypothetical protein
MAVIEAEADVRRKEAASAKTLRYNARCKAEDREGFRRKQNANSQRRRDTAVATGKFRSDPCNHNFHSEHALNRHKTLVIHVDTVNGTTVEPRVAKSKKRSPDKTFYCSICKKAYVGGAYERNRHNNCVFHRRNAEEASS